MKKSRLLGAVSACLFLQVGNTAVISPSDFGPNAKIETYENLGLGSIPPNPTLIDGDTYSSDGGVNALRYNDIICVSGFCFGHKGSPVDIVLGDVVNRAGVYTVLGANAGGNSSVEFYDVEENLLGTVITGVYVPDVGYFMGWESLNTPIAHLKVRIYHDSVGAGYFDNFTTEVVPIPPAVWLFGSGLLGLIGAARLKAG